MSYLKFLIGGLIGAAIGGAIWVALGYYGNVEVGWIAWGIGFLAGVGVRMAAAPEEDGAGPGTAALASAVGVIALSKYLVIMLSINNALGGALDINVAPSPELGISQIADTIVEEHEAEEKEISWPEIGEDEDVTTEQMYPADIWQAAKLRWEEIPVAERDQKLAEIQKERMEMLQGFRQQIQQQAFKASFTPFDLLWFGLAAFTAFKVGSGAKDD